MPLIRVSKERSKEIFPPLGTQLVFGTRLRRGNQKSSESESTEMVQFNQEENSAKENPEKEDI